MNERIKELAKQAYRQDCLKNNPNWKEGVAFERFIGLMDSTFEKFAELIVRECIQSIQSDMDRETMNGTISLAKHAGMVSAKTVLKKHFGVEL
jgi:hypothetical protein